jgi:hypothetical protein
MLKSCRCFVPEIKSQEEKMKNHVTSTTDSSSVFLTGAILLANMDYSGLCEYALRAAIGGMIWMGFKLATDYFSEKMKSKK